MTRRGNKDENRAASILESAMTPPVFPEAELEMLGAIIEYPQSLYMADVSTLIRDDFFQYRGVWDSIQALLLENEEVTLVSVIEKMKDKDIPPLNQDEKDAINNPQEANLASLVKSLKKTTRSRMMFTQGIRIITAANARKPEKGMAAAHKLIQQSENVSTSFDFAGETLREKAEDFVFNANNAKVVPAFSEELRRKIGGGYPKGLMTTLLARPSMGKALHNEEKVLTTRGWQEIGSLKIEDKVYGSDGKAHEVLGVFPQGYRRIWLVKFDDGTEVRCDANHLWTVEYGQNKKTIKTKKLRSLVDTSFSSAKRKNRHVVYLPPTPVIMNAKKALPCHEYIMGAFLGCGTLGTLKKSISFKTNEYAARKLYEMIESYSFGGKMRLKQIGKDSFHLILYSSGLYDLITEKYGEKTMPASRAMAKELRRCHPEQKMHFLRGIMDTNGTARRSSLHMKLGIKSKSEVTSRYILDILRSMGFKAEYYRNDGKYVIGHLYVAGSGKAVSKKDANTRYKEIYTRPVTVAAIKERFLNNFEKSGPSLNYRKRITEVIETDDAAPMTCISVASLDKLFITEAYSLTHNTRYLLQSAIYSAQMCKEVMNSGFVQFFSQDGSPEVIWANYVISRYGYKADDFREGRVPKSIVRMVKDDLAYLKELPLEFNSDPMLTPSMAGMKISANSRKYGTEPELVIADFAQAYSPDGQYTDENQKVSKVVEEFYTLTRQADQYAFILASQLPKTIESRPNKRPQMGDGKRAGEIEERSELMIGLYRDEYYDTSSAEKNTGEVIVLKHKTGERLQTVKMGFFNGIWSPHAPCTPSDEFERDVLTVADEKYRDSLEVFETED